jgi:hypothetical protein
MELENLPRKELQALAKQHGVKANLSNSAIIDALRPILEKDIEISKVEENPEPIVVVNNAPEVVVAAPQEVVVESAPVTQTKLETGITVEFTLDGQLVQGKIKRVNKLTCRIVLSNEEEVTVKSSELTIAQEKPQIVEVEMPETVEIQEIQEIPQYNQPEEIMEVASSEPEETQPIIEEAEKETNENVIMEETNVAVGEEAAAPQPEAESESNTAEIETSFNEGTSFVNEVFEIAEEIFSLSDKRKSARVSRMSRLSTVSGILSALENELLPTLLHPEENDAQNDDEEEEEENENNTVAFENSMLSLDNEENYLPQEEGDLNTSYQGGDRSLMNFEHMDTRESVDFETSMIMFGMDTPKRLSTGVPSRNTSIVKPVPVAAATAPITTGKSFANNNKKTEVKKTTSGKTPLKHTKQPQPAMVPKTNAALAKRLEAMQQKKQLESNLDEKKDQFLVKKKITTPSSTISVASNKAKPFVPVMEAPKPTKVQFDVVSDESAQNKSMNPKLAARKATPNFKRMHERQFENSKSITSIVERDSKVSVKMDAAFSAAQNVPQQQHQQNAVSTTTVLAPKVNISTKPAVVIASSNNHNVVKKPANIEAKITSFVPQDKENHAAAGNTTFISSLTKFQQFNSNPTNKLRINPKDSELF